jgi:hypothetical protein
MSEYILMRDTPSGGEAVVLNFASMPTSELADYVVLGIEEAVEEYLSRPGVAAPDQE